ncbi:MAG: carboxypeptidase-like regulatory domain-containing protein, partial [Actinomycetota bacterium]|nr:carboxypeptidase-like regulatory domain-containing protein [Actinomycetota bacterium]
MLVLIALVPRDTTAQVFYGSVVGDVKDATGGALPGATLVITNTDRGLSREAVTDAAGHFTFSNLPAGVYGLKARQQGFKGFEQKEVTVTINAV